MATPGDAHSILTAFASRLVHRGYVVLFGVVFGVIGGINDFFDGAIKLAPWMSFVIIGGSLLVAAFWAAFDLMSEQGKTIAGFQRIATGTADPRYAQLSDMLGRSTTTGAELSREGALAALDAWERHTRLIVAAAYGEGEAAHVFIRELKGGTVVQGQRIGRFLREMPPPKAEVINKLNALLGRIAGLVIRSAFDPSSWQSFDVSGFREAAARPVTEGNDSNWTCPWCLHEHESWSKHCAGCGAERAGEFVYVDAPELPPPAAGEPSELEHWLGRRIEQARLLEGQRATRSEQWYFEAMGKWDFDNVTQLHDGPDAIAPDMVDRYREDPRTGRPDGLAVAPDGRSLIDGEQDRYYGQRLAWMRATETRLSEGRSG